MALKSQTVSQQTSTTSNRNNQISATTNGNQLIVAPGESPSDICALDVLSNKIVQTATPSVKTGMCMSLKVKNQSNNSSGNLMLCGYESGHLALFDMRNASTEVCNIQLHNEPRTQNLSFVCHFQNPNRFDSFFGVVRLSVQCWVLM
jgi:hypothetical protein